MTNYLDCGQLAVIGEYQEVTASDPQSETQIWLESSFSTSFGLD
jgi:hypothetical protein